MKVIEEIKEKCCSHCEAECDGCWLKELISDYTKQVRKEVCNEIKEKLIKQYPTVYANIGESLFYSDCCLKIKELNEILDQIQGE